MDKFNSFMAIKDAIRGDSFYGYKDVYVFGDNNYIYKNVYVAIYYDISRMQMKVEIIWEEDESQPYYKNIGLFGSYDTEHQEFIFTNHQLQWQDNLYKFIIDF